MCSFKYQILYHLVSKRLFSEKPNVSSFSHIFFLSRSDIISSLSSVLLRHLPLSLQMLQDYTANVRYNKVYIYLVYVFRHSLFINYKCFFPANFNLKLAPNCKTDIATFLLFSIHWALPPRSRNYPTNQTKVAQNKKTLILFCFIKRETGAEVSASFV